MAISMNALDSNGSSTATTSQLTSSVTPTSRALVVLFVMSALGTSVTPTTPTSVSGCSLTWYKIRDDLVFDVSGGTRGACSLWGGWAASPTTGQVTISWGTASANLYSLVEFTDVMDGDSGRDAIIVGASLSGYGQTSASFATPTSGDAAYSAIARAPGANETTDVGSGWTEIHDDSMGTTPSSEIQTQWASTPPSTVSWSWTTASDWGGYYLLLKEKVGSPVGWLTA